MDDPTYSTHLLPIYTLVSCKTFSLFMAFVTSMKLILKIWACLKHVCFVQKQHWKNVFLTFPNPSYFFKFGINLKSILFQKLFLPFTFFWLKVEMMTAKGHFEINWSLEQFFLTVCQNNFGNKITFLLMENICRWKIWWWKKSFQRAKKLLTWHKRFFYNEVSSFFSFFFDDQLRD